MKGIMLICAPLCLLSFYLLPISPKKSSNQAIPLSFVEDAVDDMYLNCNAKMEKMVRKKYFEEEMKEKNMKKENKDSIFGKAWKEADGCAYRFLKDKDEIDQPLTKDHMQAICAYITEKTKIYDKFNEAVRTNRTIYGTFFRYHSLHFWLTSAVQILRNNQNCWDTYRRTKAVFTGSVNQTIRFGTFTSTSLSADLTHFGDKTCFKIKTCFGAFLKNYSHLIHEKEVLIPPYEMFSITNIENEKNDLECDVVYVLQSAGLQSNLNCYIAKLEEQGEY